MMIDFAFYTYLMWPFVMLYTLLFIFVLCFPFYSSSYIGFFLFSHYVNGSIFYHLRWRQNTNPIRSYHGWFCCNFTIVSIVAKIKSIITPTVSYHFDNCCKDCQIGRLHDPDILGKFQRSHLVLTIRKNSRAALFAFLEILSKHWLMMWYIWLFHGK